jgi:hypothetical protein
MKVSVAPDRVEEEDVGLEAMKGFGCLLNEFIPE